MPRFHFLHTMPGRGDNMEIEGLVGAMNAELQK
jgi:hypothetical protein